VFWQKKEPTFHDIDHLIRQNPGTRPAEIAKKMNIPRSTITRRLPSMEEAGYHYFEDERGGLWPFTK
jgi:DNA-binding IclR family transcriptional regulator